ncbi:MAG TPA: DUF3575 domain-containing protein [Chitinophagaceae bacterium]|nr:DUF3575 domain-containing protein [Chitinophagaceae bacterium]
MPGLFRILFSTILLLCGGTMQSSGQDTKIAPISHPFTLRINPLSVLEPDGNLMVGLGYQFNRRWAITLDPGYIFFSAYAKAANIVSLSGIKIRSDIRFLFDRSRPGRFSSFIAPEFHYKYVTTTREDDFGINCIGGQCAYNERAEYKEKKKETGISIKVGTLVTLKSRWNVELYGGLGIKFLKFQLTDIPPGGSFLHPPDTDLIANNNHHSPQLLVPAGVKFIFRL